MSRIPNSQVNGYPDNFIPFIPPKPRCSTLVENEYAEDNAA